MGNRIKAWNFFSRVLFILVFAASLGVFYYTRTGPGYTDFIINLVFAFLAAAFLIVYFAACARPLAKIAASLARVTENIQRSGEEPREIWNRFSQNTSLFENDRLDERWGAYLRQLRRMQKQSTLTADCRVGEYINEELLYSTVNKPFCDQLGGIMSGLGILFTFIGLVYGLRNFDATTVDVMQTSTQALMAGIKIAFLTSIFGLIYSLIFGLSYKKLLKDSLEVLYEFQDSYEEAVRPVNEHAAENALVRLQMEQNEAIRSFGEDIGEQISRSIIALMKPTVDELQDTITRYVNVAIEDQRAGMDRVVRYFLDSMNSSMGNIFVQLKTRTEELTRWEKDMIDSISVLTAGMGKYTQDLYEAQTRAQAIASTMSEYTDSIETLTASQRKVIDAMRLLMEDYRDRHIKEEDYLRSAASAMDTAAANTRDSKRLAESVASIAAELQAQSGENARQVTAAGQLLSQSADSIRLMSQSVTADVTAAAERLERAAGDLDSSLARTVGDSLAMMDDSLARLTNCLSGVNTAAGNITAAMKGLPKTVSTMETDVKSTAKVIDGELKLLLKAVSDTEKAMTRFSAELERRTSLS